MNPTEYQTSSDQFNNFGYFIYRISLLKQIREPIKNDIFSKNHWTDLLRTMLSSFRKL